MNSEGDLRLACSRVVSSEGDKAETFWAVSHMDGCPGVGVTWDKVALQTNLCDRALAPMYIHRTGKTSGGRGGAELLFLFRGHCEMVSSRGWSGSGALLVDSWLGSIAALVWLWCVLGLTPAVLGGSGEDWAGLGGSVGQVFEEPLEVGVSILSEVL